MKKSFRALLAVAATTAVFIGFQNFTSAQISQTAIIPPAGVTGNFDVKGGYLRKYTHNLKIDINSCEGGLKPWGGPYEVYCLLASNKIFSDISNSYPAYLGKTQLTYDPDLKINISASNNQLIVKFDVYPISGTSVMASGITPEMKADIEQRMKALASKYGYIRVVGAFEDSSTLPTISR